MGMNVRFDDEVAVLSNIGRLMNDPRHHDSAAEVDALLDQGFRRFVVELREVGTLGPAGLGLLTTLTRRVRQGGGDLVLARVRRSLEEFLEEMRMDTYWDIFADADEAKAHLLRHPPHPRA